VESCHPLESHQPTSKPKKFAQPLKSQRYARYLVSPITLQINHKDYFRKPLLGTSKQQQSDNVRDLFDLLSKKECNKHLLFFLLDLVVVRFIPELALETPKELYDLRTP
jgi:hypothetical protein